MSEAVSATRAEDDGIMAVQNSTKFLFKSLFGLAGTF